MVSCREIYKKGSHIRSLVKHYRICMTVLIKIFYCICQFCFLKEPFPYGFQKTKDSDRWHPFGFIKAGQSITDVCVCLDVHHTVIL